MKNKSDRKIHSIVPEPVLQFVQHDVTCLINLSPVLVVDVLSKVAVVVVVVGVGVAVAVSQSQQQQRPPAEVVVTVLVVVAAAV